jgi:C2H2 transcription facotor
MTFQSVNSAASRLDRPQLRDSDHDGDTQTPTTPRVSAAFIFAGQDMSGTRQHMSATTLSPTTSSIPGQRPLPSSAFTFPPQAQNQPVSTQAEFSAPSTQNDGEMDVDSSEDDHDGTDTETEHRDPDNEAEHRETDKSSKKKKGQKFFCVEFPPCGLSFTRSEHLARHIRKHTGERPFECHCTRRFSRLDNLRQHAQTVHVNEDIPAESLAATGTRYQRQIRTDKIRTPGSRARTGNNVTSRNGHSRGHSRNHSSSSIGSTASNYSAIESRRRPPPLVVANDLGSRPPPPLERPATPSSHHHGYSASSPDLVTPTSATFSTNPGSPGYGSVMDSPVSAGSRGEAFNPLSPSRRLSVPAGGHSFHPPPPHTRTHSYTSQAPSTASNFSTGSANFASSPPSQFPYPRMDPGISAAEAERRRRTWHPSSYYISGSTHSRPVTSRLSFSQTPDSLQPAMRPPPQTSTVSTPRLPGIESFDQVQHRPTTPPRRQPSPMEIDSPLPPPPPPPPPPAFTDLRSFHQPAPLNADYRRAHFSWDGSSRHRPATRSNLQAEQSRGTTSWGQQTLNDLRNAAARPSAQVNTNNAYRPGLAAPPNENPRPLRQGKFLPQLNTSSRNRRQGWHSGPSNSASTGPVNRRSPEDSSSSEGVCTPRTSGAEVHPAIKHSNGDVEPVLPVEIQSQVSAICHVIPRQPS